MSKLDYRPELDGLRGASLIIALLYHVGLERFIPGGFVVVDIFFVISGFIITRIIHTEYESTGKFDYANFYTRRARRILPGFFCTIFVTLILSRLFLLPDDLQHMGGAVLHALTGISNIYFQFNTGYFDGLHSVKPLLHTWSLGVEEQFYLFWPLMMIFIFSRKHLFTAISLFLSIFIISFGLNIFFEDNTQALFYQTPMRAFEFWIGASFVFINKKSPCSEKTQDILFLIGLILISFGIYTLNQDSVFPSYNALIPCLGAGLIIYSGSSKFIGLSLKNRLFVWLGIISYSVYLVHWPVMVIYKTIRQAASSNIEKIGLCLGCIFLGWLQFKFVESRFRLKKHENVSRVSGSVFGMRYLILLTPVIVYSSYMWRDKYEPKYDDLVSKRTVRVDKRRKREMMWDICSFEERNITLKERRVFRTNKFVPKCNKKAKIQILTLGNSHEVNSYIVYYNLLVRKYTDVNIVYSNTIERKGTPCHFEEGDEQPLFSKEKECSNLMDELNNYKKIASEFDVIVLGAYKAPSEGYNFLRYISILQKLNPKLKVIVHGSLYDTSPFNCIDLINRNKTLMACNKDFGTRDGNYFNPNEEKEIRTKFPNLKFFYVNILNLFCPSGKLSSCDLVVDGIPMFFDESHYSAHGTVQQIRRIFKNKELFNSLQTYIRK